MKDLKESKEEVVPPRVYSGKYKGHIELKYPQANAKAGQVRLEILKNINKRDLIDIYLDIVKLQNSFYTLEVIFSAYKENESIIKK
jgi:hypothetical protein